MSDTNAADLRVLRIVFWVITASPILLALTLGFVRSQHAAPEGVESLVMPLRIVAVVLALGASFGSGFLIDLVIANARKAPRPDVMGLYRTTTILGAAMCEGAALFAAVAWFLTNDSFTLAAGAVALFALLQRQPTKGGLDALRRRLDAT